VLEQTLYNGLLSGISLRGDRFFYPNPLESDAKYEFNQGATTRKPWFDCACCPVNVARFVPSIPGYVYAWQDDVLYINLFIESQAKLKIGEIPVKVAQETRYPWEGKVRITINPGEAAEFTVKVRIPGWSQNKPVPSDLYSFWQQKEEQIVLKVNSEVFILDMEKGFARLHRKWKNGDVIELNLPLPIRRIVAHDRVEKNVGKVALQRGPLVYCLEGIDNEGQVLNKHLPDDMSFEVVFRPELLGGINVITGKSTEGDVRLVAIPYYAWSHRGIGEMTVWIPRQKVD
jgi:DUF1680 family protein